MNESHDEKFEDMDDWSPFCRNYYHQMKINFNASLKRWECVRRRGDYIQDFKKWPWKRVGSGKFSKYLVPFYLDPIIDAKELCLIEREDFECCAKNQQHLKEIEVTLTFMLGNYFSPVPEPVIPLVIHHLQNDENAGEKSLTIYNHQDGSEKTLMCRDIYNGFPRYIDLRIFIDRKKSEIIKSFEAYIDHYKWLQKNIGKRKMRKAVDWEYLSKCFMVYDLRMRNPQHSFPEIADKLFPSEDGVAWKSCDSPAQQCKNYYYAAKDFIDGGYLEIP